MKASRRTFVMLLGAAAAAAPAFAHTPYGQWVVYRQKHLLVGAHRGDLRTYELAQQIVAGLDRELPEAKARIARGPRPQRIASLLGTGQLFLAVLSIQEAGNMARAEDVFKSYRPIPLAVLADLGSSYQLVAAPDFPDKHVRLVAEAIDHAGLGQRPDSNTLADNKLAMHPGAVKYWDKQ